MGNPKQKWTTEEEAALRAGVAKHGTGKWKVIRSDPQFNQLVFARSNAALKDKWRSLCAANVKENPGDTPAAPLPTAQTSPSVATSSKDASVDIDTLDSSRYNTMIFEALSGLNDLNGSDSGAIANFIEKRHEVPQNFKRMLTQRLGTLVQQEKLEKVQNLYRIKNDTVLDKRTLAPRSEEAQPNPIQSIGYLDEAAESAARLIAEAENSSFLAAESMKEAERVSRLAEEMEALLQFARDCLDQCSDGEVLLRD